MDARNAQIMQLEKVSRQLWVNFVSDMRWDCMHRSAAFRQFGKEVEIAG